MECPYTSIVFITDDLNMILLSKKKTLLEVTVVFMSVDQSRDVACNVPTRFCLWRCSSSI